jgi:hypothetical protein
LVDIYLDIWDLVGYLQQGISHYQQIITILCLISITIVSLISTTVVSLISTTVVSLISITVVSLISTTVVSLISITVVSLISKYSYGARLIGFEGYFAFLSHSQTILGVNCKDEQKQCLDSVHVNVYNDSN